MSLVMKRNSVRDYTQQKVSKEDITKLLTSAMQAPSACNQQPWEFIVIDDKETLTKLSKASNGAWMLANAPLCITVIMTETEVAPLMREQDCAAATQNILLEAVNLGLGAVWIGVHPIVDRTEYVNKVLNITKGTAFANIAIGYPNKQRDINIRYDEARVHHNKVK